MLAQSTQPLMQRHGMKGRIPSAVAADGDSDIIPTIVLSPELAIQTLRLDRLRIDVSSCPNAPDLTVTGIGSSKFSQAVLYGLNEQKKSKKRQRAALLSATVIKESRHITLGMGIQKVNGSLQVSFLRTGCLLSDAPFVAGDKLVSINNIDCTKKRLSSVAAMLKKITGLLTIVVENTEGDSQLVESMVMKAAPKSKTGLGVALASGHRIRVSSIDPKGVFASSLVSRRDNILSINATPCECILDATEAAKLIVQSDRIVTVLAERKSDSAAVVAQANPPFAMVVTCRGTQL